MKRHWYLAIILFSMALFSGATLASAATVCEVWSTDVDGNPEIEFDLGETVYIHWKADGEVDIVVYAPNGVTVDQEWQNQQSNGVVSFVPSHGSGIYTVECKGSIRPIAVGTFRMHAVPELPFGTIVALCVMLVALIIKTAR